MNTPTHQLLLLPMPKRPFQSPSIEEVLLAAAKTGLPEHEAHKFFSYFESINWHVGRKKMTNWTQAMNNWKLRWQEKMRLTGIIPPHVRLRSIEYLIDNHPANRDSGNFDANRTPEQKAELQQLRAKRDDLHRQIASTL